MSFTQTRDRLPHWLSRMLKIPSTGDISLFVDIFRTYFRIFWKKYVIIFILIGFVSGTTAGIAWMVKDVVETVFVDQKAPLILPLFFAVVAVFLVRGLSLYFQSVLSNQISNALVADIQNRMFEHIMRQKVSFFSRYSSDDLTMRFNQGAAGFNSILNQVLVNGLRDAATLVALLGVMLFQDAYLTICSFLVAPIVFYGVSRLLRRIRGLVGAELAGYQYLNRQVRETVQGITVIKAFRLEQPLLSESREIIEGLRQQKNRIAALNAAPLPLLDTVGGVAVGLAILYAGWRLTMGVYSPGTFMSFLTALLLAADPARRLSQMRVQIRTAMMAVEMVNSLLNDTDYEESGPTRLPAPAGHSISEEAEPAVPAIAFENVDFRYGDGGLVLDGMNLEIKQGEMIALVGPSGAGKSTVFKLLMKFFLPTGGTLRLFGHDVGQLDTGDIRDSIAFVSQSNYIFSGTIRDNLTLKDSSVSHERVVAACEAVGLHSFIEAQPAGYDTDVGELGAMISGGQAQRLNMARAIIRDAPILLLDEVTSALDAENEQLIKDYVRSQAKKKTIIVIAHRLSTVKEADRIALIDSGHVTDQGTHDELVERNDYYKRIVMLQFEMGEAAE
ncbi:ABC transporter ATP-binding protein [Amorphus coralli]|uniref:ABC transporter ATP-binding protein n=1 Tax=Amorphus coralli TaxID=340680 RepID=UPI000370E6B1|nr:ABC transporter ATP-binding protein [Amorphus coralli]